MARVYLLLFIVGLVITVAALIDCLGSEAEPKNLPRLLWVFIILLFSPVGGIAWFVVGRPKPVSWPGSGERMGSHTSASKRPRPLAPDDDPEFLESLRTQQREDQRKDDEELFRRWEADLRRREEELRRKTDRGATETDDTSRPPASDDDKR